MPNDTTIAYLALRDEQERAGHGEALKRARFTGIVETQQPQVLYHAYVDGSFRATHRGLAGAVARLDRHHARVAPLEALGRLLVDGANLLELAADRLSTGIDTGEAQRLRKDAHRAQRPGWASSPLSREG